MIVRDCVLRPRVYVGDTVPPLTVEDTSRYGNNGTLTTMTRLFLPSGLWVLNKNANACQMHWESSASELPTLNIRDAFTYLQWVRFTTWSGGEDYTLYKTNIRLSLSATHYLRLYIVGATNSAFYSTDTIPVVLGEWTFLAVTYAGTNALISLYVNGILDGATASNSGRINSHITFDMDSPSVGLTARGQLHTPGLFIYSMTAAQIWDKYQNTRGWYGR